MDPSCPVETSQAAGGVLVWRIYSWHSLDPLVLTEHRLNGAAYLSMVADHVCPFMTTVDVTSSWIMHHATKLRSSHVDFWNTTMSFVFGIGMWWNERFAS